MYLLLHPFFKVESQSFMIEVKIIGIGSPYGDDQLGWNVIEMISQSNELQFYKPEHLLIEYHDRPGIRLLEYMKDAKMVILVDAIVTKNKSPGTCYRFQNEELYGCDFPLSSHEIGVEETLQLGKVLNCLPKDIILYGIEIDSCHSISEISPVVQSSIVELAHLIVDEVKETLRMVTSKTKIM